MIGTSLIDPIDVARFVIAYVALVCAPGYALATLARPRGDRLSRVALALPCAYSLVTVYGLATLLLHMPFTLAGYGMATLLVTAAGMGLALKDHGMGRTRPSRTCDCGRMAAYADRSREKTSCGAAVPVRCHATMRIGLSVPTRGTDSPPMRIGLSVPTRGTDSPTGVAGPVWIIPVAIALLEGLLVLLIHRDDVVPSAVDVLAHVVWTQTIMHAHVFPIALLAAHVGTGADGAFYPPAFHAMSALVTTAGGIPAYRAVFYSAVVAGCALPIALYTYTRALLGSARLAAVAVLASLAFEPLPFYALAQGLYPFVVSCLFIPALALALADGAGRGDRRAVGLAALLGVGLFYTHPTEFLTVGLLALVTVAPALRGRHTWPRAIGSTLLVAAAWLIAAAPALAAARRTITGGRGPRYRRGTISRRSRASTPPRCSTRTSTEFTGATLATCWAWRWRLASPGAWCGGATLDWSWRNSSCSPCGSTPRASTCRGRSMPYHSRGRSTNGWPRRTTGSCRRWPRSASPRCGVRYACAICSPRHTSSSLEPPASRRPCSPRHNTLPSTRPPATACRLEASGPRGYGTVALTTV